MEAYNPTDANDPRQLAAKARESFLERSQGAAQHHPDEEMSVREVRYKGRRIRIETRYRITVDGQPVSGHVDVNNEGRVHYHSIPNQEFASAVDLVKRVIDLTPPAGHAGPSAGGHGH